MANVTTRTANWRLFGGGGLAVGGVLWALHILLVQAGVLTLGPWVYVVALVVIAVAFVFVALGETGSNGAVGNNLLGRVALIVYGAGFLLLAVNAVASFGQVATVIAAVFIIIGGLLSAYLVYKEGVAKGLARWFLIVPALIGAIWVVGALGVPGVSGLWGLQLALALLLLVTGVLYLFNDRKVG